MLAPHSNDSCGYRQWVSYHAGSSATRIYSIQVRLKTASRVSTSLDVVHVATPEPQPLLRLVICTCRIRGSPSIYTGIPLPWNGDQIPLTLSLLLWTGFAVLLSFSPLASLSSSAFLIICSGSMFRTHIAFCLPLM